MGLLSRIRASSSARSTHDRSDKDDLPPLPPPRPSMLPLAPPSPVFSSPVPGSPSSSISSSRLKPWKRGKSKDVDTQSIAGPAYTSAAQASYAFAQPLLPPPKPGQREAFATRQSFSGHAPRAPATMPRMNSTPLLDSYQRDPPSSFAVRSRPSDDRERKRRSSGDWKREGGILGMLGFEKDSGQTNSPISLPQASPSSSFAPLSKDSSILAGLNGSPVLSDGSLVFVGKDEYQAMQSDEEGVEVLESDERRQQKFWKLRRPSKTGSDTGLDTEELNSPTPRKNGLPATPSESVTGHARSSSEAPRPRQTRRPSSSFFFRNTSRTSLHEPLDVQPGIDDGSFQLRGFRHISGTSDVEGAVQLNGYLAHVKKPPSVAVPSETSVAGPASQIEQSLPASPSYIDPLPAPRRPDLSRPPSASGSSVSVDGHLSSAPKVSAAAFRKGIRKPSESSHIATAEVEPDVQPSVSMPDDRDDEEEDDAPLGQLQMRRKESHASLPQLQRESLAASFPAAAVPANDHSGAEDSGPISSLTIRPSREQLNTTQGPRFTILKASTPPIVSSPVSVSPLPTPPPLSPNPTPPPISTTTLPAVAPSAPAEAARPHPPPIKPIELPQAGDTTPSTSELPLPPDQMPSTPPPVSPHPVEDTTPSAARRGGHARKASLLEEPLKAITDFWKGGTNDPTDEQDGRDDFDPALVMRSIEVFGATSPPKATMVMADRSEARTPPFEGQPRRATLQDRLASVASSGPISPSSPPTSSAPSSAAVPVSTSVSSVPASQVRSSFARAPAVRPRASADQLRLKKTSWSDSEDEDEDDDHDIKGKAIPKQVQQADLGRIPSARKVPSGPRKMSMKSRDVSGTSTVHPTDSVQDKENVLDRVPGVPQISTEFVKPLSSSSAVNKARTTAFEIAPPLPLSTTDPSTAAASVPMGINARSHLSSPSPASSQSGVTSETFPQGMHPMTPRQDQLSLIPGPSGATGKPELPRLSTAYRTDPLPPVPPAVAGSSRDRRLSTATAPGASGPYSYGPMPGLTPSPTMSNLALAAPPGVDPDAYRHMMKQHWQAQYMAAAFRASEQEWERQSNMSESGRAESVAPSQVASRRPHPGQQQQHGQLPPTSFRPPFMPSMPSPMSMSGYPFYHGAPQYGQPHYGPMQSMPYGYPFLPPHSSLPSSPSFGPGHLPLSHSPGQGQGMYAFAPGPQSVFGGEFGPPTSFPALGGAYPPSPIGMGMGYGGSGLPTITGGSEVGGHTRPISSMNHQARATSYAHPSMNQAQSHDRGSYGPQGAPGHGQRPAHPHAQSYGPSVSHGPAPTRPAGGLRQSQSSASGWANQATPRKGSKLVN